MKKGGSAKRNCLIIMFVGLIILAMSVTDLYSLAFRGTKGFEDFTNDELTKGQMFSGEIGYVADEVAELESSKTLYGISYSTKKNPCYLIMTEDGFAVMHVGSSELQKKMDSNMRASWDLFESNKAGELPEGVYAQAKAVKMPSKLKLILKDYFLAAGYTKEELNDLIPQFLLEEVDFDIIKMKFAVGLSVFGVPLVVLAALSIAGRRKKSAGNIAQGE